MGTKIYGIVAAENHDNANEKILIDGVDISRLKLIKDEHPSQDSFFHSVGSIQFAKKIYSEKDCENHKQLRCWKSAQVPFVYGEGVLADDEDHPNAKASAAMLRFAQRNDVPLEVGFSVDGGIAERKTLDGQLTDDEEDGKILSKTLALAASLTLKPCNPKCKIFMENDLQKSGVLAPPPPNYLQLLQKTQKKHSIFTSIESQKAELYIQVTTLKKSLDDYFSGFTSLRCNHCSKPVRFFKSGDSLPNTCGSCGNPFSMKQLWKALNQ